MPISRIDDIKNPEAALNIGSANIPPPIQVPTTIKMLPTTLLDFMAKISAQLTDVF
ncbi:hypothetical protein GAMM_60283 [Gammaproteobacteria bacterium]